MPLFLLTNWKWLVPTAIAAFCALMWGWTELDLAHLKTAQAEADKVATEKARKKDAENSALAAAIDQANLEKRDALDKAADAARDVARSRGLYVKAKCNLPRTPDVAGSSESGSSEVRLSDEFADAIIAFAKRADAAAIYGQQCHEWAVKIGR